MTATRKSLHYKAYSISENYHYQFVMSEPGSSWRTGAYSNGHYAWSVPPIASVTPSLLTEAENGAKTLFVSKVRQAQTALQGGVILGELGQTIRLIKSPFRRIGRVFGEYVDVLKKRRRTLRSLSVERRRDLIQDTWLEYSFGLRPLINDVNDGISAFNDILGNDFLTTTSVRAAKERERVISTVTDATVGQFEIDVVEIHKAIVIYLAGIGAATSAAGHSARSIGLDISNWAPTVWELVPYSFLVDYVTNIGDIISAASLCSQSTTWGCKIVVQEIRYESNAWRPKFILTQAPTPYGTDGLRTWTPGIVSPGAFSSYVRTVTRSPSIGSLVPSLEFSIPNSAGKLMNLASLFIRSRKLERALK